MDILTIFLAFFLFGLIHSYLASNKFKQKLKKRFGSLAFYRLFYNIFSFILLLVIFLIIPKPRLIIYDLPSKFDVVILLIKLIAAAGFIWTFKYISFGEFLGIGQVKRWMKNSYNDELDEKLTFRIEGPYKIVRHPIYLFSIIFLTAQTSMDLFYLTLLILFILYFFIGSYYEEKKLVEHFGDDYKSYKKAVPGIIPWKFALYKKNN